jgi:hypothetical protein
MSSLIGICSPDKCNLFRFRLNVNYSVRYASFQRTRLEFSFVIENFGATFPVRTCQINFHNLWAYISSTHTESEPKRWLGLGWVSKEPNSDELLIESVYRLCGETTEFDTNSEWRSLYRYFRLSWDLGFDDFKSLSYRGDRARYVYAEAP